MVVGAVENLETEMLQGRTMVKDKLVKLLAQLAITLREFVFTPNIVRQRLWLCESVGGYSRGGFSVSVVVWGDDTFYPKRFMVCVA